MEQPKEEKKECNCTGPWDCQCPDILKSFYGIRAPMSNEEKAKEGVCELCKVEYQVWFCDNHLWNKFSGKYHFLCADCFMEVSQDRGLKTTGFKIMPEEIIDELQDRIKELEKDLKDQEENFCSMTSNRTAFKFWNEQKKRIAELESKLKELQRSDNQDELWDELWEIIINGKAGTPENKTSYLEKQFRIVRIK